MFGREQRCAHVPTQKKLLRHCRAPCDGGAVQRRAALNIAAGQSGYTGVFRVGVNVHQDAAAGQRERQNDDECVYQLVLL